MVHTDGRVKDEKKLNPQPRIIKLDFIKLTLQIANLKKKNPLSTS